MAGQTNHVLITTAAGVGKSHLADFFRKRGKNIIEGDEVLMYYVDGEGNRRPPPTKEEMDAKVPWSAQWDGEKLKKLLDGNRELYVFGTSGNVYKLAHLFDSCYFLTIDRDTHEKRLVNSDRARTGKFGARPEERERIYKMYDDKKKSAEILHFKMVDSTLPTEKVFDIICQKVPARTKLKG